MNRLLVPKFSFRLQGYGSHLPVLDQVIRRTDGPILEMGSGLFSTSWLHWACAASKRPLVTYENDGEWYHLFTKQFEADFHQTHLIYGRRGSNGWDRVPIDQPWAVALIDHEPMRRRRHDVAKLANLAQYIVLHDAGPEQEPATRFGEIWPLFRWCYLYQNYWPNTAVVSNFHDLTNFSVI